MGFERARAQGPGPRGGPALVLGASPGFAHLVGRLLSTRFEPIATRGSCAEALEALRRDPYDLLVLDLEAKGDPLGLIDALGELPEQRPAVLAVARVRDLELETALSLRGAIGVLEKPIAPAALFRALRGLCGGPFRAVAPRVRVSPHASAEVLDPTTGEVLLRWEIRDVSRSGAFLLSHAPLFLGERLRMRLRFGDEVLQLDAEVVRVQEPGWSVFPGIAVRFRDPDTEALRRLDGVVERWLTEAERSWACGGAPERR